MSLQRPLKPTRPLWDGLLSDTDQEVIHRGGYGQPRGLGQRPALIVIDAQYNYCGEDQPILRQIDSWPSGAGESAWRAMAKIKQLLTAVRQARLPVIYTRQMQQARQFDGFAAKARRDDSNYRTGAKGTQIVEALTPLAEELVLDKSYASAFYGTPLLSWLVGLRVDTLLVTGGTSSGCVRTLCVDAVSRCFQVAVVTDAVFDRIDVAHKVALLDLWMKYCDLHDTAEMIDYVSKVAATPPPTLTAIAAKREPNQD